MKVVTVATTVLLLAANASLAQDYQGEVGLTIREGDFADSTTLYGEWNFDRVNTAGRPLAEASYLGRNNKVRAAYTDFDGGDLTSIGAEIYFAELFYVAPTYADRDPDFGDDDNLSVALGLTPTEGLRIITVVPEDNYDLNLQAKYVSQLAGESFVNLEAAYEERSGDDYFSIGGDLYLDHTFSIGGALMEADDTAWEVRADKFFTDTVRGRVSFTDYDGDEVITVGGSLRF